MICSKQHHSCALCMLSRTRDERRQGILINQGLPVQKYGGGRESESTEAGRGAQLPRCCDGYEAHAVCAFLLGTKGTALSPALSDTLCMSFIKATDQGIEPVGTVHKPHAELVLIGAHVHECCLHGRAEPGGRAAGDVQAAAASDVVQLLLSQQRQR